MSAGPRDHDFTSLPTRRGIDRNWIRSVFISRESFRGEVGFREPYPNRHWRHGSKIRVRLQPAKGRGYLVDGLHAVGRTSVVSRSAERRASLTVMNHCATHRARTRKHRVDRRVPRPDRMFAADFNSLGACSCPFPRAPNRPAWRNTARSSPSADHYSIRPPSVRDCHRVKGWTGEESVMASGRKLNAGQR